MTPSRFRSLLPWIAALSVASCDSGFDPLPPVDVEAWFSIELQVPDRALEGAVEATATCQTLLGGVPAEPDRVTLKVEGATVATTEGATIVSPVTLSSVGAHTVTAECMLGDEIGTAEQTIEVVEPAWVTVHLRNFTQDGEPFVRGDGPITFTVGDTQVVSEDSAVVPVLPGRSYEIFADHPDFLPSWASIVNHATGERLEFYQIRDQSSPVWTGTSVAIDVYKLREADIVTVSSGRGVDELRRVLYGDNTPYTGTLRRFDVDTLGVHVSREDLNGLPSVQRAIQNHLVDDGPFHISKLTQGVIQYVVVSNEPFPRGTSAIYVDLSPSTHPYSYQNAWTDSDGVLHECSMTLASGTSERTAEAFFLQCLGLTASHFADEAILLASADANPSPFALLAMKILYQSPPGARF